MYFKYVTPQISCFNVLQRSLLLGEIENAQAKCGEEIAFPLTIKIASNYHDIRKDKHVE